MLKKILIIPFLVLLTNIYGQDCPLLNMPLNGDTNVLVETTLNWGHVTGVTGYIISLGTSPNGTDIINQRAVGSSTSFTPPLGLPENTEIFVTITLFFFDQPNITCTSESFTTEDVTTAPECTSLTSPTNGATNVNSATNITWSYAQKATSYQLILGSSPGGNDILDENVGNVLFYNPSADLPASATIYARIIPINGNGSAIACIEESFSTGAIATLPNCTSLISPVDGAINIPLTPFLEWTEVPDATGYRVSIGNSPFTTEILNNVTFFKNSTFVINFEPNSLFFMTITPFNDAGDAIGCAQESFSTVLGCGPYFDSVTGELTTLNPDISFPDIIPICSNELPLNYTSTDIADGFRWFKVDQFGIEVLISDTAIVDFSEGGDYKYEAYNIISQSGNDIECATTKFFSVEASGIAIINAIKVTAQVSDFRIEVLAEGEGAYEFALNKDGPYQESNLFPNVPKGQITVFVRDKNGCGIAEKTVEQDLSIEGFPKFFTPNGDGINDFWQFIPSELNNISDLSAIFIFDRFGIYLNRIEPTSMGWDGNYNGNPLPSSDYWFKAMLGDGRTITGHFSLKR